MRVLDLGCHDGYVGAWLRAKLQADLVIDGMELHPDACDRARERGYRKVVQAPAEDAPQHFEIGSYDAVVLFELIEHVPDIDTLLTSAEAMVAPGGGVFLSTPDGTFGSGHNPHHLRALRAIDLADLARRRGRLEAFEVGRDTIATAAYSPRARLDDVAIYTGPSLMPWSPTDIVTKGLGGSETAAVRLAEQLAELGYVVTVYGEITEECAFGDVIFRSFLSFDPAEPRAAVISSRYPEIAERPLNARTRLLWTHDVDCGDRLTQRFAERFDRILVLSEWHEQHMAGRYPFASSKLVRTRNGIHLPWFQGQEEEREQRVVYTSSPDRGLDILLELWPEIRKHAPDAELAWAYSPVYFHVAERNPALADHVAKIRELSEQDGVTALGSLSQPKVAELMRTSMVWVAPSWCTPADEPFHETSCIGAMEAQAAGLHVVASGWGALPETVQVGRLVNGGAPGKQWREAIVSNIVEGLTDPEVRTYCQEVGPMAMGAMGWAGVACQVAGLIEGEVVEP